MSKFYGLALNRKEDRQNVRGVSCAQRNHNDLPPQCSVNKMIVRVHIAKIYILSYQHDTATCSRFHRRPVCQPCIMCRKDWVPIPLRSALHRHRRKLFND